MNLAVENEGNAVVYDTNAEILFSTDDVVGEISKFIDSSKPEVILSSTYKSLAECYRVNIEKITNVTGKKFSTLYIIGGRQPGPVFKSADG